MNGPQKMFGPHVNRDRAPAGAPLAAHVEAARREAEAESGFPIRAAAVFVGGPRVRRVSLSDAEAADLRAYSARAGVRLVAHSAYVAAPWRGDAAAAAHIRAEAAACQAAGIGALVVHLPKLPLEAVLARAGDLLCPAAPGVRIFLETPAVRPAESFYETPAKLAALLRALAAAGWGGRFGVCVDTAHLWTCGVDLASRAAAEAWLQGLEAEGVPFGALMFHLNDSARPRGVGPDAHAPLGRGLIWGRYAGGDFAAGDFADSGLAAFVDFARRHSLVAILERSPPGGLRGDYALLRALGAA